MFSLAWKNIIRRLGGSLMTALIAFIAVFVLATSLAVVASLENGQRLSRERLGADIMVPQGPRATPRKCSFAPSRSTCTCRPTSSEPLPKPPAWNRHAPILHANGQPELLLGDRGDARGGY